MENKVEITNNPEGYRASLADINTCLDELRTKLQREGHLLPGGIESLRTSEGKTLVESLGQEDAALLLPTATLQGYTGSYWCVPQTSGNQDIAQQS